MAAGLIALQLRILARSRSVTRLVLRGTVRRRPEAVTPALLDRVMLHLRRSGAGAAFRRWERREGGWNDLRTNYVDRLATLSVPTLIVHGADDPVVPLAVVERAQRLIPDCRLIVIPDCGHLAPLEQPEAVSSALDAFLQAV